MLQRQKFRPPRVTASRLWATGSNVRQKMRVLRVPASFPERLTKPIKAATAMLGNNVSAKMMLYFPGNIPTNQRAVSGPQIWLRSYPSRAQSQKRGQKPVGADMIENVLARDINGLEPRLTRQGYLSADLIVR
jgi:hypothetical protein